MPIDIRNKLTQAERDYVMGFIQSINRFFPPLPDVGAITTMTEGIHLGLAFAAEHPEWAIAILATLNDTMRLSGVDMEESAQIRRTFVEHWPVFEEDGTWRA